MTLNLTSQPIEKSKDDLLGRSNIVTAITRGYLCQG